MNIVLLGATGGIGKCLSLDLSSSHSLFIGSRNMIQVDKLVNDIKSENVNSSNLINGCSVDATNFKSASDFLNNSNEFLGSIDCIINCVGSLLLKPAHLTSEEEFNDVIRTNVFSCFSILKYSFKYLKNNGGSIIFFSSAASKIGLKNHESISSAKAAISSMALSAAA